MTASGHAVRITDAHAHLWQRARTLQPWIDPVRMRVLDRDFWIDDLVQMQREANIDDAIVIQSSNTLQETRDLLAVADRSASVLGVVGWVDLEGDVAMQVAGLRAGPGGDRLVGIRHLAHEESDPLWLARPTLDLGVLSELGLAFDLVVHPHQLAAAVAAVAAHPEVRFVLDHLGNPPIAGGHLVEWNRDLARIAAYGNVVVKLSGILLQADWDSWTIDDLREPVAVARSLFGPERMMFGSDWPLATLAADPATWVDVVSELLPAEHHAQILGGTARRVYLGQK